MAGIQAERIQTVAHEASQLQDQFVRILTHTKIEFSKKTLDFLNELRITLTTLPLSNAFRRLSFLRESRSAIENAQSVAEIFEILHYHWNYIDYALLQRIVEEFGSRVLQNEMGEYMATLEKFERGTTILDFCQAKRGHRDIPYNFSRIVLRLHKDPSQCTLYEIRQLVASMSESSSLDPYAMLLEEVSTSSVSVKIAFPRVALEVIIPALDSHFLETHHVVSVIVDEKPLEEYNEEYVKVCILYCNWTVGGQLTSIV